MFKFYHSSCTHIKKKKKFFINNAFASKSHSLKKFKKVNMDAIFVYFFSPKMYRLIEIAIISQILRAKGSKTLL